MGFTQEQTDKISSWIQQKVVNKNCPCCGTNNWSFGDVLITTSEFNFRTETGRGLPLLPVTCKNCAYTMMFAARVIGIV
jgi:predicted nucleic-acid-binding Zn-ribbon protein